MTPTETTAILRQLNEWRRGDETTAQPDPREIGEAIDTAIEMIVRLESAEKERANANAAAVNIALEAERLQCENDALRAKIEAMEKQAPAMWANSSNIISARISTERGSAGDQHTCSETKTAYHDTPLYLAPGAKGEDK